MHLSKGKFIFVRKMVSCLIVCLLSFVTIYANNMSSPPIYIRTPIDVENQKNTGAIANPTIKSEEIVDYASIEAPLLRYYNEQLIKYKSLNNYHEENYLYNNGQHSISYYDGILTKVIKDFDNDGMLEMAMFRIITKALDEFSNKEIILQMIEVVNGNAILADEMVISSELYIGEEIECNIGMKYVNDTWRIYLNYFDRQVREEHYENKFIALEYHNNINVISQVNMSADGNEFYEETYEFRDEIIDAGISLQDDSEIYKKAFINSDMSVSPIFMIKRVNEKIRDGYVEDYFEQQVSEKKDDNPIRIRYGYTLFINRINS